MKNSRSHRADISLALIHLTGPRCGRSALELLISILSSRTIRASGQDGFIKGPTPAVCFTEMPLASVPKVVDASQNTKHPYAGYGLALHKSAAFAAGARPVIYLPDAEAGWIPHEQKWRHVRYEHGEVDFTHEREWRAPGDFQLNNFGFYVIVGGHECEHRARAEVSQRDLHGVLGFIHLNTLVDFL